MIKLSIVTVLYKQTEQELRNWLDHLLSLFYYLKLYDIEIILVDNNAEHNCYNLDDYDDYKILSVGLTKNSGYCSGNNFGINLSLGDYILILNPDVYIKNSRWSTRKKIMNMLYILLFITYLQKSLIVNL